MHRLIATGCSLLVFAVLFIGVGAAQSSTAGATDLHSGRIVPAAYQWGRELPNGSYQQSCQDIRRHGNRIEARCQKRDGGYRDTSINYHDCRGQIVNDDGNLRCDTTGRYQSGGWQGDRDRDRDDRDYDHDRDRSGYGWQGGMPQGSYQQTCQNANMNGSLLQARCRRRDGGWRDSSMDLRSCRGDIINDDGNLRCDNNGRGWQGGRWGGWQNGMPQGSFQQTCQNVNVNGYMLQARCAKRDGGYRNTSLDYRSCRGDIINDDGNLRCGGGSYQGGGFGGFSGGRYPQGGYQQSCQNINVNGGVLQARCQKRDGGWRDTSLNYRSCRNDIINDDGNLKCR